MNSKEFMIDFLKRKKCNCMKWQELESRDQLPVDGVPFLALIEGKSESTKLPVVLTISDGIPYQYLFTELIGDEEEHVQLDNITHFCILVDENGKRF